MLAYRLRNERAHPGTKAAIPVAGVALSMVLGALLLGVFAHAQERVVSLGELARRERERKASAAKSEQVIDLLNLKHDCGGDWSCFLAALKEGKPARITFPDTIETSHSSIHSTGDFSGDSAGDSAGDSTGSSTGESAGEPAKDSEDHSEGHSESHFEGMAIHSDVILETDKLTEDSAVLSGTTKNTTVLLTDPERARLLLKGYTRDAIDARERQAQEKAKRQDGSFVTCFFQKKALQEFLEKRQEGEFSDRDWELAEHCDVPGDGPDNGPNSPAAAPDAPSSSPNP